MGSTDTRTFAEGDAITPDLTAVRLLGGGSSYEAYLAFDEITYAPVVVKVVRPGLVTDESSLRGLRREVDGAGRGQPPGRGPRAEAPARRRPAPRRTRADRRAAAVVAGPALRTAAGAAVPPAGHRDRQRAALPAPPRLGAPGHQARATGSRARLRAADRPSRWRGGSRTRPRSPCRSARTSTSSRRVRPADDGGAGARAR